MQIRRASSISASFAVYASIPRTGSELAVELFYPADPESAGLLRGQ